MKGLKYILNNRQISFSPPDIGEEEISAVCDTLRSGWITTGPKTKEFEKKIAEYVKSDCAVCLNSATAALELTLLALGIGKGDEVITTAYTYTATCAVICHVGATPVLIDTKKDSYFMDLEKLSDAITAKTKAVIPVDIAGVPCDYDGIFEVLENKKSLFNAKNPIAKAIGRVAFICDCAHSLGAVYKGKLCGSIADFSCFSFHAVKNLTTGEGGAVTFSSTNGKNVEELYKQYMLLSLHGQNKDALSKTKLGSWEYDILNTGYKCNMTDIMAAIGTVQLSRYDTLLARRREIIGSYNHAFKGTKILPLSHESDNIDSSYLSSGHLYITNIKGADIEFRNEAIVKLAEFGIAANVHYKPLPLLTAYKNIGFSIQDYPNAQALYQNELTLPLHTLLTNDDVSYIIDKYIQIVK